MKAPTALLLASCLLLGTAGAQEDEAPVFDVEIIVFRHLEPDDTEDIRPPEEAEDDEEVRRRRFTPLGAEQLRLTDINQTLLRSEAWSPVLYYGWRQPVESRETAAAVSVAGNRGGAFVSGTVRLSLERFLRLEIALEMDPGTGELYPLDQARRIRSGRLHYFDHPQFGVIALVSRAPADQAPQGE